MCKKIYIAIPKNSGFNFLDNYLSDTYFSISEVNEEIDEDFLLNEFVFNVIPSGYIIGLGGKEEYEKISNLLQEPLIPQKVKEEIGEIVENNLKELNYDVQQWYLLTKELIWDYGLKSVAIYYSYSDCSQLVHDVINISINELSTQLLIDLPRNTLLNIKSTTNN